MHKWFYTRDDWETEKRERERETERGHAVGLSCAGQGGGVGGWGVANWFHWILAWWPHLPTMTSCHMYARNRVKSSALHPVLYTTGWPLCVCIDVCVCVEHENVPWSLNRVGTSQSFIIFALFLFFFFVYFCSTSVFLSFRLSLCFLFLVYDKFNDLFVVLCFRRCLSSTHNTATRDYVMFVVYLVVSTFFFFFCCHLFCILYSVSKYYGMGYTVHTGTETLEEVENLQ